MYHINKVLSVVINGCSSQFGQNVVFAERGCPIHNETSQLAKLEQCGTNAAARANNEHLITGFNLCSSMQHLVSRHIVQDQGYGFCRVQGCRHLNKMLFPKIDVFGIATMSN